MKLIRIVQHASPCLNPDSKDFNVNARPGMIMIGQQLISERYIDFTVTDISVKYFRFQPNNKPVLYIVFSSGDCQLQLRPLLVDRLGEMEVGKTYHLNSRLFNFANNEFYAFVVEEKK